MALPFLAILLSSIFFSTQGAPIYSTYLFSYDGSDYNTVPYVCLCYDLAAMNWAIMMLKTGGGKGNLCAAHDTDTLSSQGGTKYRFDGFGRNYCIGSVKNNDIYGSCSDTYYASNNCLYAIDTLEQNTFDLTNTTMHYFDSFAYPNGKDHIWSVSNKSCLHGYGEYLTSADYVGCFASDVGEATLDVDPNTSSSGSGITSGVVGNVPISKRNLIIAIVVPVSFVVLIVICYCRRKRTLLTNASLGGNTVGIQVGYPTATTQYISPPQPYIYQQPGHNMNMGQTPLSTPPIGYAIPVYSESNAIPNYNSVPIYVTPSAPTYEKQILL